MNLKVFLDDMRQTPEGWTRVYWPEEAIALLKTGKVAIISLDHDLGEDERNGYDVLLWIEEMVINQGFAPPEIRLHTDNSSALQKMRLAVASIKKHAGRFQ